MSLLTCGEPYFFEVSLSLEFYRLMYGMIKLSYGSFQKVVVLKLHHNERLCSY